jgi:hypothetical protein
MTQDPLISEHRFTFSTSFSYCITLNFAEKKETEKHHRSGKPFNKLTDFLLSCVMEE